VEIVARRLHVEAPDAKADGSYLIMACVSPSPRVHSAVTS